MTTTGARRGRVVAFGSRDPQLGTERAIVMVEAAALEAEAARKLELEIRAAVMRRLGLSIDVVELVPPRTILRTSSGKTRRSETRALWSRGELVRRRVLSTRLPLLIAVARFLPMPSTSRSRPDSSLRIRNVSVPKASTILFA